MHGLAHRRERAGLRAERAEHDLAGVETDADLDRDAPRPLHGVPVRGDPLLHPEGRIAGADRVVLLRQRSAEQREDPVAQHVHHGALVASHRLRHVLDHAAEDRGRLLRVVAREHGQGGRDVREEHGDVLALAGQIRARRQVIATGATGVGGGRSAGRRPCEREPAERTEPGPRWRHLLAGRAADHRERRGQRFGPTRDGA
jgi:hypothetical protein